MDWNLHEHAFAFHVISFCWNPNRALGTNHALGRNYGYSAICSNNLFIIPSTMSLDLDNAEIFEDVQTALSAPELLYATESERLTVIAAVVLYLVHPHPDLTLSLAKSVVEPLIRQKNTLLRSKIKRAYDKQYVTTRNNPRPNPASANRIFGGYRRTWDLAMESGSGSG
jgi:hypothetical protein